MEAPPARIARYLDDIGAEAERRAEGEWVVRLPSQKRGAIAAGVAVGERTLSARAFVMRGPDREHAAVYRRVLRKNLSTRHWRFALDDAGDLFAVADLPLPSVDGPVLDELLGGLCTLVDETYEGIVRTGFDVPPGTDFRPPPGS